MATGVNDHAESEYAIFIIREPTLQNSSTVISIGLSYFLLRNLFLKIFLGACAYSSEIIIDPCSAFYARLQRNYFYGVCKKKIFSRRLICHHSVENLILHITEVVSESTQVYERMSATNTSWNTPKTQYSGRNPYFSSDDIP